MAKVTEFEKWMLNYRDKHGTEPCALSIWAGATRQAQEKLASVTGLGSNTTIEETVKWIMERTNNSVKLRDAFQGAQEAMACGHPKACEVKMGEGVYTLSCSACKRERQAVKQDRRLSERWQEWVRLKARLDETDYLRTLIANLTEHDKRCGCLFCMRFIDLERQIAALDKPGGAKE